MTLKEHLNDSKRINEVSFLIGFSPINRIERYMYDLGDDLKQLFPDDVVDTKIPSMFDPKVPRFVLRDNKKRRFLEVSVEAAVFKMIITKDYSRDIIKGIQYFKEKTILIINALQKVLDVTPIDLAATFQVNFSTMQLTELDPKTFFCKKFLNPQSTQNPYLFNFNIAFVEDNYFYVNYKTEDYEEKKFHFKEGTLKSRPNTFYKLGPEDFEKIEVIDKGIRVITEINNKYFVSGVGEQCPEIPNRESITKIFDISQNKIDQLVDFIS